MSEFGWKDTGEGEPGEVTRKWDNVERYERIIGSRANVVDRTNQFGFGEVELEAEWYRRQDDGGGTEATWNRVEHAYGPAHITDPARLVVVREGDDGPVSTMYTYDSERDQLLVDELYPPAHDADTTNVPLITGSAADRGDGGARTMRFGDALDFHDLTAHMADGGNVRIELPKPPEENGQ